MTSAKRLFEWYFGVPPAAPGQGTGWRIESSLGSSGWPNEVIVVAAALLVAAVTTLYFREAHRLSRSRRLSLAGLRLAALGLIVVMLAQVTLAIDRTGLPTVAVMIDDSASMGLPGGAANGSSGPETRLDQARRALTRNEGEFLRSLGRRFRLHVYRFDAEAVSLSPHDAPGDDIAKVTERLDELTADGAQTRPAGAVRRVLDDLRGAPPSAIIVLTDGVATAEGEALSAIAPLAAQRRTPLFPIGIGAEGAVRDLDLHDVTADEVAFLGDPVRVTARFRGFGLRGESATLTLTNRETGAVLAEKITEIGPDGRPVQVEIAFTPEAEGEIDVVLALRTEAAEGNTSNNTIVRHVSVRNQKVRVLLADHAPRYEFRFLKSLLEREPSVELDTVLQEADLGFSSEDRTALERFPLRKEEILAYDVIIFGDLDPRLLGADSLTSLAEFVRVKGGGLIGIAGSEFFPVRYAGTPLESLLPVALGDLSVPSSDVIVGEPFRTQLTLHGQQAGPMFRMADGDAGDDAIWNELPGFYWRADAPTLRPGAVVLVEAMEGTAARSAPVIAMQRFGAGKVLLHLTDETWRWRFRAGDTYFGRYWIQAIRFLSRSALLGRDRAAELTADRRRYSQGEPTTLRLRFLDDRLIPQAGRVTAILEDGIGDRKEIELQPTGDLSESFESRIDRLPAGRYHAWISEPAFAGTPPSVDFQVDPPDQELSRREPNFADLRKAAEGSGGKFSTPREAAMLPTGLPAGRPVRLEASPSHPLWNRPELLVAFVGVLSAEWLLRKRARLA